MRASLACGACKCRRLWAARASKPGTSMPWHKRAVQACGARVAVQVEAAIKAAVDAHGHISGVANCVGSIVLRSAHATSEAEFDQVRGGTWW